MLPAHCTQQALNPNTAPNNGFSDGTSILSGEWKLIFTSALDVLSLGLLPGIDVGQVFQNISDDGTEVNRFAYMLHPLNTNSIPGIYWLYGKSRNSHYSHQYFVMLLTA